ncbi:MAG: TolC family protein, partial [Acidobacteria bacterium]
MTARATDSSRRAPRSAAVLLALLPLLGGLPLAAAAGQQESPAQLTPVQQPAPGTPLTLEEALRLAEERSERMAIARAGVSRATGDEVRARADLFPQLSAFVSYDRTLATEFSGLFDQPAGAACDPFTSRPSTPLADRVSEIERAIDCGAIGGNLFGGADLDLPFGRENILRLNLSFSQTLYSGGRIGAQRNLASVGRRQADVTLASARAQLALDVTQAFYDAALSDHLRSIAEAGLRQASATLAQVELARQAGRLPEFELLRARVARDNQQPIVLRARAQRTLAYLRLQQLLHLPDGPGLQVAANLDDLQLPPPTPFAEALTRADAARRTAAYEQRTPVRQATAGVEAREAAFRLARSERLPNVIANSSYGRVAYSGLPAWSDWRTNWTIGVAAQVPLFTGGRLRGDEIVARADLDEARAQLELARNLAQLDSRAVYEELDAARATWEASSGTVEEAVRAYQIAELRYREGISTQLELSDARFLLEQSQANRAQAGRDLQVARARVALLPDLPLSTTGLPLSEGATGAFAPTVRGRAAASPNTSGTSPAGVAGQQGGAARTAP